MSVDEAHTLIASCVAAHKLDSGMYFSRLFLADFLQIHGLSTGSMIAKLRSSTAGNELFGDYHESVLSVARRIECDREVKDIIQNLES